MAKPQSSRFINSLQIHVDNNIHENKDAVAENIGTNASEEEMEEGEASEDEVEVNVIVSQPTSEFVPLSFNPNKKAPKFAKRRLPKKTEHDDHIEFIDNLPNEEILEGRASHGNFVSRANLQKLYKSLEIEEDDFHRGGWRSDALHMRGINGMRTEDVFEYFGSYSPNNIEWLNDDSCNVVWTEKTGAARALLGLSCPIQPSIKKAKTHHPARRRSTPPQMEKIISKRIASADEKKKKSNAKTPTDKSSTSSEESSDSSDEEEQQFSSSSSSSEDSSSSNSSSDNSSSSSSSNSDSSSEESSDNEAESSKMDIDESQVKKEPKKPLAKDTIKVTHDPDLAEHDPDSVSAESIGVPVPPGKWRLGVPSPFVKAIFLRFAHCKDKKVRLNKPIAIKEKYSSPKASSRYSPERRRKRNTEIYKTSVHNERVPPLYTSKRTIPENHTPFEDSEKSYHDLDDPFGDEHNPWGFLAQNWGRRETQDSLDYHALLRKHVSDGKKRKSRFSGSEDETAPHKRRRNLPRDREEESYADEYHDDTRLNDDIVAWKSKITLPRMRMYADAEEKRKVKQRDTDVQDRIGLTSKSFSKQRQFDLRAKLQNKRRDYRGSYSESD